jgi:hypothetical protein
MVHTRQEIRTDLSSVGRGNRDIDFSEGQEESNLEDTASHAPEVSTQVGHEELTGPQIRQAPRQPRDVRPTMSAPQEQVEVPPQTTPVGPSVSYVDPMLLAQLVKAVMEGMANDATPMPAPLPVPIIPTISEAATATNDAVHLVRLVKSMREIGCEPYSGEQNAEVAGIWIRKVEKTMIQTKYHRKMKEREFLALIKEEQLGLDLLLGEVARQAKQVHDFPPICTYTI